MLSRSRFPSATALCSVLHLLASCATAAPFDFLDSYRHTSLALRDAVTSVPDVSDQRSLLPAQICGIVGGYVATVLIWGILLLTVGRKMRSRRFENPPAPLDVELVNARPQVRVLTKTPASPGSARSVSSWSKKIFSKKDKTTDSAIGSPQSPVVQSPSSFDQNVLDANKERAQAEMERLYAAVMEHDRKKSYSQVSADEVELNSRRPSAINTSREVPNYSNPSSPVKAIYPPNYHNGPPTAPLPRDRLRDQQPPSSPRSILSKKSHTSNASTGSKARFNLKNLRISGPVGKYPSEPQDDEARTPLSPRFYNPGAPPSPPTMQNSPTTPGTIEEAYEQLDEVQPLPRPAPQRAGSSSAATPTGTQPPALQITKSAASSNSSLPLRGYAEPLKSPDLRTTVLDRKMNNLSMTTPKTGVPFTPYSPYMPFTPITPVTPHLVTKKERKMMHKMEKRRQDARDEMVQSPKEIFGDAY